VEGGPETDAIAELRRAEHELANAVRLRDLQLAETLDADGFLLTSALGTGLRIAREEWLDGLDEIETERLEFRDLQARVIGETGVVVWLMDWIARLGDDDLSGPYVVTDVWSRTVGGWRLTWRSWARLNADFLG